MSDREDYELDENDEKDEKDELDEVDEKDEQNEKESEESKKTHYCYIIFDAFNCTYNGYTVNLERRLRQHNGEIKGGARFTARKRLRSGSLHHWQYLLSVTSPDPSFDSRKALSLEWSIKNPTNRRTRPKRTPIGRIESLPLIFSNPKFSYIPFTLYVHYGSFYEKICETLVTFPHVTIVPAW